MQKIITIITLVLAVMMIGCDEGNPVNNNNGEDTTKVEGWPLVQIEYQKTMQVGNDQLFKVILDKPEILDSIIVLTIWNDTNRTGSFRGSEIKDTLEWLYNPGAEGSFGEMIRMYQKGVKKDTVVNTTWIDSFHVSIKKGTFGIHELKIGDALHLYVITEAKYTPYVCQWYKDGIKIGNSFVRNGNDSISYDKSNVDMSDAGEYSISLDKPNAPLTEGGITVRINN